MLYDQDHACMIGDRHATVLQHIHYWVEVNKEAGRNFREGHYWTYNSYEKWQKLFYHWSSKTIKRIFEQLEEKRIVISGSFNQHKYDRTKWYRIDYERLAELEDEYFAEKERKRQECQGIGQTVPTDLPKMTQPIPENNSEIITDPQTIEHFRHLQELDLQKKVSQPSQRQRMNQALRRVDG